MQKYLITFILFFAFSSASYAYNGWYAHRQPGGDDTECFASQSTACNSWVSHDGVFIGNWKGTYCKYQTTGGTSGGHNVGMSPCDIPSCADFEGQTFTTTLRFNNDEGEDDANGCYFACEGIFSLEGGNEYECTYNGQFAQENIDQTDPDEYTNVDTNDPEYCNNSNRDGDCIDYDHPDNEGGCKSHGKTYGTFGTEFGSVTGCFGGQSDYEPSADRDDDGIANEDDPDIDGDGVLNEDDPDEDGDGFNEKKDTDGDGIPDSKDPDIDGDGIPNGQDGDKDGDGIDNEDDQTPDGEKATGEASTCNKKPTSSGDAQLTAILLQLWINECSEKEKMSEPSKIGSGGTGSWWESEYPDGFSGVWEGKQSDVENGAMVGWLEGFSMSDSGTCPSFPISVDLGFMNLGTFDPLSDYCWIFAIIKSILILTAAFTARALIFGG